MKVLDCIIIGGGQSGLACAYYLRRTSFSYLILDGSENPGGAWNDTWDSLTLFSPAKYSSLPGKPFSINANDYPSKQDVLEYLRNYENHYSFPVIRPIQVIGVNKSVDGIFKITTDKEVYFSKSIIAATGTFRSPFIPKIDGLEKFSGEQLHSSAYRNADEFIGKNVLVVGEGNSGAQIMAELANVTLTFWAVRNPPYFLPPEVDGKVLFDQASAIYYAQKTGGNTDDKKIHLGNIVLLPAVKAAKNRGDFDQYKVLKSVTTNGVYWEDDSFESIDAIIWCTGFNYHTDYLNHLVDMDARGRVELTESNEAEQCPGLFFVGFGNWTGFASATLIGVGRTARKVVKELENRLT
jgi:putative flavoprotein involved in K+ transport